MKYQLHHGDCLEVMAGMEAGSVDAVVTDPPYGLEFMGKEWDRLWAKRDKSQDLTGKSSSPFLAARVDKYEAGEPAQAWHEQWATAAIRVLAPSHYLLAFGGTRTWHRLACALEDAGFEIRDTLMWLYGSGFPKGKACLKPAWEPVILARKPGPMRELGIEECRIGYETVNGGNLADNPHLRQTIKHTGSAFGANQEAAVNPSGRWPANLVLDEVAASMVDEASGILSSHPGTYRNVGAAGCYSPERPVGAVASPGDSGGASRFFFNVKGDPCDVNTAGLSSCPLSGLDASALSDALTLAARVASEQAAAGREATAACTSSCSGCTQTPNPALCAAILASIGTIQTTTSPSKSCGSVARATDAPTNSASAGRVAVDSDQESVTRFLYCAKASRRERNAGLEGMEERPVRDSGSEFGTMSMWNGENGDDEWRAKNPNKPTANHHPTVKPVALMRWLVKLVAREGDTVLDPFTGSGTTGVACVEDGRDFIGIEREAEYVEIARRRIEAATAQERLPV